MGKVKKAPDKTEEEGKARFALPKPIENDKMIEIEMERNEEEARRSKKDRQERKKRKMEEGESSTEEEVGYTNARKEEAVGTMY